MSKSVRIILYGLLGILSLAGGSVVILWLAGYIYVAMQGQWPNSVPISLWIDLWTWEKAPAALRASLLRAMGTACLISVLGGLVLVQLFVRRPDTDLHGKARFARADEIRQKGLFRSEGLIVGRLSERLLRFAGEEFVMLAAPTRSGKGVAVVVPNLLDFPHSVVVIDIKLEHFHLTSAYRKSLGQKIFLFNPFATDGQTHCWNPLDTIRRDSVHCVSDVLAIAHILYPQGHDKDAFWNDQARNLFLGLVLLIMETRPGRLNLSEVLAEVSGREDDPRVSLRKAVLTLQKGPFVQICKDALTRFCLTSENTFTSILATFNGPLTVFSNPRVAAATARSDIRVDELRRKRVTIYLGIGPADLSQGAVLLNLFVSRLIQLNVEVQPADDPALKVPCLLILDEFAALGRIEILARASAYIASYGLRLLTVIQSHAQLDALYGPLEAKTLRTNHALHIHFTPRESSDAARLSERLGYLDIEATTRSQSVGRRSHTSSQSISRHRRALRLPQELQAMDSEDSLLILDGVAPIEAKKAFYFKMPLFLGRLTAVSGYLASLKKKRFTHSEINTAARTDLFVKVTQGAVTPTPTPAPVPAMPNAVAVPDESHRPKPAANSVSSKGGDAVHERGDEANLTAKPERKRHRPRTRQIETDPAKFRIHTR